MLHLTEGGVERPPALTAVIFTAGADSPYSRACAIRCTCAQAESAWAHLFVKAVPVTARLARATVGSRCARTL